MSADQEGEAVEAALLHTTVALSASAAAQPTRRCAQCGAPLPTTGLDCPNCLLRSSLLRGSAGASSDPSSSAIAATEKPLPARPALHFAHFEISTRDDGTAWELGRGTMGVTYRAFDTVLRCGVALKVIDARVAVHSDARVRFLREARAAAQLRHPHVATVFHFGETDGNCFYAMELVEGETLEARVRRDGPLPAPLALEIATQVARALRAAEAHGLVHRDLKPSNIMLATEETSGVSEGGATVKVIDFGLAKAVAAAAAGEPDLTHGGFVGTPAFASPEQFAASDSTQGLDVRSDIFSLGVTLWFLLTGKVPFPGRTLHEIHALHTSQPLPLDRLAREKVPAPVVGLLRTMLASDPAQRPQSARELVAALHRCREIVVAAPRRRRAWLVVGISGLLLCLLAAAAVIVLGRAFLRPPPNVATPGPGGQVAAIPEKSIAVLPFRPLVPEAHDQVLEIGMADTLITRLSNSRLIVPSLNSVRKYGGLEQDPVAAGRALGVRAVLEGSVQKTGDRLRVTARLINVADGGSLWAGTFDEKFSNVFSVQDAISEKVADALALHLNGEEKQRLTRRYTDNVAAYQLYLIGRYHWNKLVPPEIKTSLDYFQQAIDLDPNYALAYFGLAEAYRSLTITGDERPTETIPKARAAALKALELDASLADAHASLVFDDMWFDWDWATAEKEARRGIELNPNSAFVHVAYAVLLSDLGRHAEATAEGARAVELDPVSLLVNALHGANLYYARRYEEAVARLQKTLGLDPNFWIAHLFLGKIALQKGSYGEALTEFTKARDFSGGNAQAVSLLGYTLARAGNAAQAQTVLDELKDQSGKRYLPPCTVALVYLGQGKRDDAFAWLERAHQERDVLLSSLKCDPQWDPLREEPRFDALLARIGLRGGEPAAPSSKSIAVLPFENLSDDRENGYFADGVQDEVLTDLSKVADLKVISRTSVMQYRHADGRGGAPRNLREIGRALGVAHVVEGSVRRAANRVRVTAQLIDTRTDTHVWAEKYDRELADVFAIQTEIAQAIVDTLQAKLSPKEKAAMEEPPTRDFLAYDRYAQARDIVESYLNLENDLGAALQRALTLLQEATQRDPGFVLAYCYAARAHALLYFLGFDPTPERSALAEAAVNTALRLRPESGEAHLARADYFFRCQRDFAHARAELALAQPALPNSAPFFVLSGYIARRLGQWEESLRQLQRAVELDPRNSNAAALCTDVLVQLRRFDEAARLWAEQARKWGEDPRLTAVQVASIHFAKTGETREWHAALAALPEHLDPSAGITPQRILVALIERDYAAAAHAVAVSPLQEFQDVDFSFYFPRGWYEAQIARAQGDRARARAGFAAARAALEARPQKRADDPRTLAVLAQIDAGLGHKEQALREAERAVALMPISQDAYDGPLVLQGLAQVQVWTGEKDRALEALATLVRTPGYLSYGFLRQDPAWAPLRGDARFEKILAALAPPGH